MTDAWRFQREDAGPVVAAALVPAVLVRLLAADDVPWWWLPAVFVLGAAAGLAILARVPVGVGTASTVDDTLPTPRVPAEVERDDDTSPVSRFAAAPALTATDADQDDDATVLIPGRPPTIPPPEPIRRIGPWVLVESQKVGNDPDMNEDAVSASDDGRIAAVADGASSAFASGLWARLLVDDVAEHRRDLTEIDARAELLDGCSVRWQEATAGEASWWHDEARSRGSFAAVAAVVRLDDGRWRAVAKGDCCVIVLDGERQVASSFPIDASSDFGLTPDLVGVGSSPTDGWLEWSGEVTADGVLMLASDGFAQWLLDDETRAGRFFATDADGWLTLLDDARTSGDMVNDDVAVAIVHGGPG